MVRLEEEKTMISLPGAKARLHFAAADTLAGVPFLASSEAMQVAPFMCWK
jgi:hypothetical protein